MNESSKVAQALIISAPRAGTLAAMPEGAVVPINFSGATSAVVDLTKLAQQTLTTASPSQLRKGVTGNELTVYADGANMGIVCGVTLASVTGANAPSLTAYATISASGVVTVLAAGACFVVPSGTSVRFMLQQPSAYAPQVGPTNGDNFLGIVSAGAGTCRIYMSSSPTA